jgi:hypothetical protein
MIFDKAGQFIEEPFEKDLKKHPTALIIKVIEDEENYSSF